MVGIIGLYITGRLDTLTFEIFDISNSIIISIFAMLLILWYINFRKFMMYLKDFRDSLGSIR